MTQFPGTILGGIWGGHGTTGKLRLTLLAITAALMPISASAGVILSTSQTSNSANDGTSGMWLAQEFVSPSVATTITDVKLLIDSAGLQTTDSLSLYSDNGSGTPMSLVASLGTVMFDGAATTETFTPGSSVNLAANTDYWLVFTGTNWTWYDTTSIAVTGMTGANILLPSKYSPNSGGSWSAQNSTPYIFTIDGDATMSTTPEPATISMIPLGFAALWVLRSRRRSKHAKICLGSSTAKG